MVDKSGPERVSFEQSQVVTVKCSKHMPEVQKHGFIFEKWICGNFFSGYQGEYMQEWDVPAQFNKGDRVPAEFRNLPVSIKTAKAGSPIGLGDVLRQRKIRETFLMIAGFWKQGTPTAKWFTDIGVVKITSEAWTRLWGKLMLTDIEIIDQVVKNKEEHYSIVRRKAQDWKLGALVKTSSFVINPKIDSKAQRRIQCSMRYGMFWDLAGRLPSPKDKPDLWGRTFPNPIESSARTFNRKPGI